MGISEPNHLGGWLARVLATRPHEITCSECFDQISTYVDLEVTGQDAASALPDVRQHLLQCPACAEDYEALLDLVWIEARDEWDVFVGTPGNSGELVGTP
jgi:hypothetical protein